MSLSPAADPNQPYLRFGRFDGIVWTLITALILAIILLIWRGDQVDVRVVALSPADAATGVSLQSPVQIQFDQPLDTRSVSTDLFQVSPPVSGTLRVELDTLTFVPDGTLAPDTQYEITLLPGLRSVQGHELAEPVEWSMRTGNLAVVFTRLDESNREQLMWAEIRPTATGLNADNLRSISADPYGIWDFTVDPRGGQIVYSRLNEDGTSDFWTLRPGATEPELLLACPGAACTTAAFGPQSRLMAYSERTASDFSMPAVSPPRLWLLDLGTDVTARVLPDEQQLGFEPRWSADGNWLSYLSPDQGGIGLYHLENGTTRFYPTTTGEPAIWHPSKNEIILSQMQESADYFEVHLFNVDPIADTAQRLAQHDLPVEDSSPAWSPDGEWLVWRRKELEGPRESLGKQLWMMRQDGSEARPLTTDPEYDHGFPSWSPDGRYLLYHRFPLRGPGVTISVWIMDVSSGESWQVADPGQRPQWRP